ncbi:hypothetical protein CSKR_201131, partial [Clonorchis sinensis]
EQRAHTNQWCDWLRQDPRSQVFSACITEHRKAKVHPEKPLGRNHLLSNRVRCLQILRPTKPDGLHIAGF